MDINKDSGDYCVYMHTSPNDKKYIGVTKQHPPTKRWKHNGRGYIKNEHFYRAIQKYGWDKFKHEILIDNISKDKAFELEKALIKKLNSNDYRFGYNICSGGEGCCGMTGENNPRYGKKLSKETIEKIKKTKKENPTIYTPERLEKLRNTMISKWKNENYRNSMTGENAPTYGRVGDKHPLYGKKGKDSKTSKMVICLTTGEVFDSAKDASVLCNVNYSTLCMCCRGIRNSCGKLENGRKLKWMYYDNYVKLINNELLG